MPSRVISSADLFAQTDYRAVLRQGYVVRKQRNQRFSFSVWARELGMKAPSGLNMILNGSRHPGPDLTRKLADNLKLSASESNYFEDLVALQKHQGRDVRQTVRLMDRIGKRRGQRNFRFVDYETLESISNWYYVAVREMVSLPDFKEDPYWICGRLHFKVTPGQISRAIKQLLALKLLTRNEAGKLVAQDAELEVGRDIESLAIQRLHRQGIQHADECLSKVKPEEREYQLSMLVLDSSQMEACKEWIRNAHNEFCDRFEKTDGDQLYQLQLMFYPMTRRGA